MNRREIVHRFHFYDHDLIDDDVGAIGAVDCHAFIDKRKRLLRLEVKTGSHQLIAKARTVGALEEAGTERAMNTDRCLDELWT